MTQKSHSDLPPLEVWKVEHLRMTAFPTPSYRANASTWWADVMGDSPETNILQPKKGEMERIQLEAANSSYKC
jgi:hypothetical protein